MTYNLPPLPAGQRWHIYKEMSFLVVELQEKRRWRWKTIARATDWWEAGEAGLRGCVDHIVHRHEHERVRVMLEAKRKAEQSQIPLGYIEGEDR